MALTFEPHEPWSTIVVGLALVAALLLLGRGFLDRWQVLGQRVITRSAVLATSLAAALCFATAAFNPLYVNRPDPDALHLAVLVDVSESVQRAAGGWPQIQAMAAPIVAAGVNQTPATIQEKSNADLVTFGSSAVMAEGNLPLRELPDAFLRLQPNAFAPTQSTDLAAALLQAGGRIQSAGGRGAVLLISDGNQTTGDGLTAAENLAQQGIPIHILPITGGEPIFAVAANLPTQVEAEVDTFLRGRLLNRQPVPIQARLSITRNHGLPASLIRFGEALGVTAPVSLEPERDGRLRQRLRFAGVGLQFLDLVLQQADGLVGDRQRFFTHVNRPLKLLAVGGDNRWTGAIATNRAQITVLTPAELTVATDLTDFDALVISSVAADEFSTETLRHVVTQVADTGLGLMVFNGDHAGATEEDATILMSYADTPVDPALPVSVDPRPFTPEPPPRQVAFIMDVSGSMAGLNLAKSQEIARYIVNTFLRPQDRLDLLLFGGGATYLIRDSLMTDGNKARAIAAIDTIQAGGGSDANAAMALLERDRQLDCGLIFISDGEIVEFDAVNTHPDCRATAFAIGQTSVPATSPLNDLADPFPVTAEFDPAGIEIPYFKPEPRDKFFEPGDYTPLPLNRLMHISDRLPVPALPLTGNAITYLRENADLIAVRPKLTDPVLAYRAYGAGYVGVVTTAIPDPWLEAAEGRAAVTAWIERLAAYQVRDRYTFDLVDGGNTLDLTIALRAQADGLPDVDRLNAAVIIAEPVIGAAPGVTTTVAGGTVINVALRPDPDIPATFHGTIALPRLPVAQEATLVVTEIGPDQLTRPQRIPLLIPPGGATAASTTAERYSYGRNDALLNAIAAAGGGIEFDPAKPDAVPPFFQRQPPEQRGDPLWPWLVAAATVFYLTAIGVRRLDI